MCFGSVRVSKISSRGASKSRVMTISRSPRFEIEMLDLFASPMSALLVLLLDLVQVFVESIEPLLPKASIPLYPVGHLPEPVRLEPAGTPLRFAAARDEARPLQHLKVLRD